MQMNTSQGCPSNWARWYFQDILFVWATCSSRCGSFRVRSRIDETLGFGLINKNKRHNKVGRGARFMCGLSVHQVKSCTWGATRQSGVLPQVGSRGLLVLHCGTVLQNVGRKPQNGWLGLDLHFRPAHDRIWYPSWGPCTSTIVIIAKEIQQGYRTSVGNLQSKDARDVNPA